MSFHPVLNHVLPPRSSITQNAYWHVLHYVCFIAPIGLMVCGAPPQRRRIRRDEDQSEGSVKTWGSEDAKMFLVIYALVTFFFSSRCR